LLSPFAIEGAEHGVEIVRRLRPDAYQRRGLVFPIDIPLQGGRQQGHERAIAHAALFSFENGGEKVGNGSGGLTSLRAAQ
jgi:hypothetical protein